MRNDAQKLAFALNCREIEKEGGDVLAFIEQNWPSYTPRATWYNLQRQYLHRTTSQLTEGKAVDPEEMRTRELKTDKAKQLEMVMKILQEGGDPIAYLADLGYKVPTQAWADLRVWARKHRPGDRAKMPDNLKVYYKEHGLQGWRPDPKTVVKTPEDYRKKYPGGIMSKKAVQKPAASPTCCQPARPSGVTVPDELPEEPAVEVAEPIEVAFEKAEKATQKIGQALVNLAQQIGPPDDEPLLISGVMSRVLRNNKYELMRTGSGHLTIVLSGRDDHFNQENILILTPNQWRDLSREINVMLKQLEVKE